MIGWLRKHMGSVVSCCQCLNMILETEQQPVTHWNTLCMSSPSSLHLSPSLIATNFSICSHHPYQNCSIWNLVSAFPSVQTVLNFSASHWCQHKWINYRFYSLILRSETDTSKCTDEAESIPDVLNFQKYSQSDRTLLRLITYVPCYSWEAMVSHINWIFITSSDHTGFYWLYHTYRQSADKLTYVN